VRARALLAAALAGLSCASGPAVASDDDRIDQILSRAGEQAERRAFDSGPPPSLPPNATLGFDEKPMAPFRRGPSRVRTGRTRSAKSK
jgi:hypothetical protein